MRGQGHWAEGVPEETLTRAQAQQVLRRLFRMLRPYWGSMALVTLMLVGQVGALLGGPALVGHGIDAIRHRDRTTLDRSALLYLLLAFVALVMGRLVIRLIARMGESFLRGLRMRVFQHLMTLSMDFFETEKTGRLVARMTSDIDALSELLAMGLVLLVQNVLIFLGAVLAIFWLSWELALVVVVIVPPVYIASRWFRKVSNKAYLEVRDSIATNMSTLQEGLEGIRVVQAYGREGSFTERFAETNEQQFRANLVTVRISSLYFPAIEYAGVIGTAVIIGVGGWLSSRDVLSVGTVAAFALYLQNLFDPVQQLSQLYNTVQSAGAALRKVFELLDERPSVSEKPGAIDLPRRGTIDVTHVSFAYVDEVVLRDVTLHVEQGERLALVGPTGAGKSTLAKLVARFYDPIEGTVTVGGVDLRDATIRSLRDRICVVPQEGYLFAGTLRENVRVGRAEASDAEVDAALDALGLLDRFVAFPDGLDTEVREGGSRLSAGEKQLISLTRAALADPAILVLDEATSNLDPGTEHDVEQALERLMEGRTVIVVAHRLSTAARADRIAVIDEGRLAELGTHDDLVARGGRYTALYGAWSSHHAEPEVA
jgi:ATP-binding cassette, subfamily B, bacterial